MCPQRSDRIARIEPRMPLRFHKQRYRTPKFHESIVAEDPNLDELEPKILKRGYIRQDLQDRQDRLTTRNWQA
jgi:hypothetical protein